MNFTFSSAKKDNPSTILNKKENRSSAMEEYCIKACPYIITGATILLLITGSIIVAKYTGQLFNTPQNMYEHLIQRV